MHSRHLSALLSGALHRTALSCRTVQTGRSRHPSRTHACGLGPASCCSTSRISASISLHRAPWYCDRTRFLLSQNTSQPVLQVRILQRCSYRPSQSSHIHMGSTPQKHAQITIDSLRLTMNTNSAAGDPPTSELDASFITSHYCSNKRTASLSHREEAKPEPLPPAAGLPGPPNESNRKKLPPAEPNGSSLFETPGLPPNKDGVASKLELPKNDEEFFGDPKAFFGDPNAFDLGDPKAFDLGESNAANAFL